MPVYLVNRSVVNQLMAVYLQTDRSTDSCWVIVDWWTSQTVTLTKELSKFKTLSSRERHKTKNALESSGLIISGSIVHHGQSYKQYYRDDKPISALTQERFTGSKIVVDPFR